MATLKDEMINIPNNLKSPTPLVEVSPQLLHRMRRHKRAQTLAQQVSQKNQPVAEDEGLVSDSVVSDVFVAPLRGVADSYSDLRQEETSVRESRVEVLDHTLALAQLQFETGDAQAFSSGGVASNGAALGGSGLREGMSGSVWNSGSLGSLLVLGAGVGLAAGGSGGSSPAAVPVISSKTIRVVDGPVAGAKVYVDLNDNGLLDTSEKLDSNVVGVTGANGFVNLTLTSSQAVHGLLTAGGTDTATQKAFLGVMTAPQGSEVINPLTTLMNALMDSGKTLDEAQAVISRAFGLPSGTDILRVDTYAQALAGDTQGLTAHKQTAVVANIFVAGAAAIAGPDGAADLFAAAMQQIVTKMAYVADHASATVDWNDYLIDILQTSATLVNPAASGLQDAVQAIASTNMALLNSTGMDAIANAQILAQYVLVSAMQGNDALTLQSVAVAASQMVQSGDFEAPVFSAGASVVPSVSENVPTTQVVYIPSAQDNSGSVSFAFAGGADDAKFSLDAQTGALRFLASPDADEPRSAAWSNTYQVKIKAQDASGNAAIQTVWVEVQNLDDEPPVFALGSNASVLYQENSPSTQAVYTPGVTDKVGVTGFAFVGGADDAKFSLNTQTGAFTFLSLPNYENPISAAGSNVYEVKLQASDAAGNVAEQTVKVQVTYNPLQTEAVFSAWSESDTTGLNVLQSLTAEIGTSRDQVTSDGRGNQIFPSLRLSQTIDSVTGTDIVSAAEYQSGFSISGKAAAGAESTIRFLLDNDRTDGIDGNGIKTLHIGNNDVNADGVTDAVVSYTNATGEWNISFLAGSAALKPATQGVWGSGVHQLIVDSKGNGVADADEASRLFLVANGTAQTSDASSLAKNYSVQDKITGDVFVYYTGDPDGGGTGLWTTLNANSIPAGNGGIYDGSGWNYYLNASSSDGSAANLAAHLLTSVNQQVWEFHVAQLGQLAASWGEADFAAANHQLTKSNTSRLPSLNEMLALYAANFGQASAGSESTNASTHLPGAVQAMDSVVANTGYMPSNDNLPGGWTWSLSDWEYSHWTAAPSPSGHVLASLTLGQLIDSTNNQLGFVTAVL